ncbi:hypothetical protein ACFCVY_25600 [Streptomyces sp. NPDC056411]|uniref:hypothetical protein n=1 Tax=Streptomyces sp. NPDC056411 TaxID=3345813 RepID=UPI0035DDB845
MHIRHIPLYALGAGALAVSALLLGDGNGADAATGAVTDAVTDAATGAAAPTDGAPAVAVTPGTVAPGATVTVQDGGHCGGGSARARFGGADIPALRLSPSGGGLGGTAVVPQGTAPGVYAVTVTCGGGTATGQSRGAYEGAAGRPATTARTGTVLTGTLTVSGGATDGADPAGTDPALYQGAPDPAGSPGGADDGEFSAGSADGALAAPDGPDGALPQSGSDPAGGPDDADGVLPQGGSRTGLGGSAGGGPATTALGAALLLGAAGSGVLAHRRRARGASGPRR